MRETTVAGELRVKQGKTQAKLRIEVSGQLKALLDEIAADKTEHTAKTRVRVLPLLVNETGQKLTQAMLRHRFDTARDAAGIDKAAFQFRDLRAKAAPDVEEV
ncbi:MAG TPA: hypothetical protein VFH35_12705, partial [Ramlibacter sp.]|nr:hypothetical protein [Ramlibacter sp.]